MSCVVRECLTPPFFLPPCLPTFASCPTIPQVRVFGNAAEDVEGKINKFTSNMTKLGEYFVREGSLPGPSTVRR